MPLSVFFIGSKRIGYLCLKEILELGYHVKALVTYDFLPEVEGQKAVVFLAKSNNIPILTDVDVDAPLLEKYAPDLTVVTYYKKLLKKDALYYPRLHTIGVHAGLLPKSRGMVPTNWAIPRGEEKTGISLFYYDEGADTGDIIGQKETPIGENDNIVKVRNRIEELAADLIKTYLPQIENDVAPRVKQTYEYATYVCRRIPEDHEIDWSQDNAAIYNLHRASEDAYPCYTYLKGKKIEILDAEPYPGPITYIGTPGQVGYILPNGNVLVVTGKGSLIVKKVRVDTIVYPRASKILNSTKIRLHRKGFKE